jgi:hypothetical protein
MAESYTQVPENGAGNKVHTKTRVVGSDTVHEQVVALSTEDAAKVPALGQALAAASVPVVLTDAQITTLTPVSTVTANLGSTDNAVLDNIDSATSRLTSSSCTADGSGTVTSTTALVAGGEYNATPVAPADTKQVALQTDSHGALKVAIVDSSGNAIAGVADPADGASFAASTTIASPIMGAYDANDSDTVADGKLGIVGITSTRQVKTYSTVAAVTPGTGATNLGKAEDAAHTSGDVGVMALAVVKTTTGALASDGDYVPLVVEADGGLKVTGAVPHDSADTGSPLKVGARAIATPSTGTNVAAADRSDLITDLDGALIIRRNTTLGDRFSITPVAITDGASTSILAAASTGIKSCITDITICNSSSTFVSVDLRDGTAGAVKWTLPCPPTGGVTHAFNTPLIGSAATAWAADPSAAVTTITVSISGFYTKV